MIKLRVLCVLIFAWASSCHAASPVERSYFGMHIHRADQGTPWPAVPFGSWRLWDAYVSWDRLEAQPNQWDFSRLDRYVAMADLVGVDVLLPLANTPPWAAARPDERSAYKPGNASEPADLALWDRYVRRVGERYKGRIRHYEIWNEPDDKTHFTGSLSVMVEMTCRAYRILKSIDPSILVVSPATAGGGGHIDYLDRFLGAGGKACVDVVAHHFYVPRYGAEAMVTDIRKVRAVMQKHGVVDKPLWNTETGWWFENQDGSTQGSQMRNGWRLMSTTEAADTVVKALVIARGEGVDRFYWYAWDNGNFGLIEPGSRQLKPAAKAWADTVRALEGKVVEPCVAEPTEWRCTLRGKDGKASQVQWAVPVTTLNPREGAGFYPSTSQIRWLP